MYRKASDHTLTGMMLMLTTSIALALMSALGKFAQESVSTYQVVLAQNLVSLAIVTPIVLWRRRIRGLATRHIGRHLIRDFAGLIAYFVPFVFLIWLHHRINRRLWWGLAIGFAGVLLILQPGLGIFHWAMLVGLVLFPINSFHLERHLFCVSFGFGLANQTWLPSPSILRFHKKSSRPSETNLRETTLVSGVGTAVTLVAITLLNRTEGPFLMLFYYFLVASIVMTPLAIWQWQDTSALLWFTMAGIGVLMMTVQLSLTLAFKAGETATLSPFLYFTVIWSGLIDWLVWDTIPNWLSLVGTALVIIGGTLSILLHTPYKPEESHG